MATPSRLVLSLLLLSSLSVHAQQAAVERLDAADHAIRMERIKLTGDLGMPPLAPLMPDSPRDTIYFADRVPVDQGTAPAMAEGGPGQYFNGFLPMGPGGTGTDKNEPFKYMIPGSYDEQGPPVPMVICYHGFGQSADSVALMSTLDEEANARGWIYMAPTGIDDQLFGSPISQQNTSAAVQWMLDNFNIDDDRIYLVGFSMGGGVALNYTARHRDPDGIMIAALGVVSGTMDWTAEYVMGVPVIKELLKNEYNFGGTPSEKPWEYQQSSSLYFAAGSYPPLPGLLDATLSMAVNLGSTPTYVTWDINDTIPAVLAEQPVLLGVLAGLGGTVVGKPVSGTPTTHSWAVLNEADLFNFFEGKVVDRTPAVFEALLDGSTSVSWAQVEQASAGAFSNLTGVALPGVRTLAVSDVVNADSVHVNVELADILGPANVHVTAMGSGLAYDLQINDLSAPPAWLAEPATAVLLTDTESDPFEEGLITPVPDFGVKSVDLVTNADYVGDLSSSPEPAPLGATVDLVVDGPNAATSLYLVLGLSQSLSSFKGNHKLLVAIGQPTTMIVGLGLGAGGQLTLQGGMPNDPQLVGVEILFQGILVAGSQVNSLTNLWRLDIG